MFMAQTSTKIVSVGCHDPLPNKVERSLHVRMKDEAQQEGVSVRDTLVSEAIRQYLGVRRALGTQTGTYSAEERSLGSNTNLQTIFNSCHQYIFYLTGSLFLWLFGPFPGHNAPFQLGFQNNGVLWSRVFNPRPNPQPGGPGFYFKVYSPATCFVWLLH
jgi:hypothetical protein